MSWASCEAGINGQAGTAGVLASRSAEASRRSQGGGLAASDENSHPQQDGQTALRFHIPGFSPGTRAQASFSGVSQVE